MSITYFWVGTFVCDGQSPCFARVVSIRRPNDFQSFKIKFYHYLQIINSIDLKRLTYANNSKSVLVWVEWTVAEVEPSSAISLMKRPIFNAVIAHITAITNHTIDFLRDALATMVCRSVGSFEISLCSVESGESSFKEPSDGDISLVTKTDAFDGSTVNIILIIGIRVIISLAV